MKSKLSIIASKKIQGASWIIFSVYFISWMIYFTVKNVNNVYYDGWWYWTVAEPVFSDGFNILNFPETFRGYVWPTLVQIVRLLGEKIFGSGYITYRLFTAASLALFFTKILPCLFEKKIEKIVDIMRMILLLVILIVLWGSFFICPLSDFAALFFLISGIVSIQYSFSIEKKLYRFFLAVLAGVMLYAAYNTRAAYIYALWLLLLTYIVLFVKGIMQKNKMLLDIVVGVAIGLIILALPQSLINHQYINSYSPRVVTEQYTNYENDLQKTQVLWGLRYSNYETYIGPESEYPCASVIFVDEIGYEIIEREGLSEENFSYGALAKLFFKYPMDMLSIYIRHFISLMTPKFLETYISDMYPAKGLITLIVIIIWFIALLNILIMIQVKKIDWNLFGIVFVIFVPSLLQLFGAPEIRFFLAIHLIGYFYTLYYYDYENSLIIYKRYICPILVSFVIFFMLWTGILSSILNSNQERTLLINDYNQSINSN